MGSNRGGRRDTDRWPKPPTVDTQRDHRWTLSADTLKSMGIHWAGGHPGQWGHSHCGTPGTQGHKKEHSSLVLLIYSTENPWVSTDKVTQRFAHIETIFFRKGGQWLYMGLKLSIFSLLMSYVVSSRSGIQLFLEKHLWKLSLSSNSTCFWQPFINRWIKLTTAGIKYWFKTDIIMSYVKENRLLIFKNIQIQKFNEICRRIFW